MADPVELEIGLHHRDAETWSIELKAGVPGADAEVVYSGACAPFDLLREHLLDTSQYGRLLSQILFADASVTKTFAQARTVAENRKVPLRVRLFVGPSAPELHSLRWETLWDPDNDAPLFTGDAVLFSRYLSSLDWRPVAVRSKTQLRAVVVVANPTGLSLWRPGERALAPIDVAAELERARTALGEVEMVTLGETRRATLANLLETLRDDCDILYLVCHGFLARAGAPNGSEAFGPQLLLEAEDGTVHRVAGSALVDHVRGMSSPPRLVVLASCQSAGDGSGVGDPYGGGLAALGPRLAEAGIAAVLAMQGDISVDTANRFLPVFFQKLHRDGHIDKAMAVARGAVRDRPDWWVPALFMRLKTGRIWYEPGFAPRFEKWPALISFIHRGRCTPILGPGLTDAVLGSRRELARRWASTYHFPLAPHAQEDLPQVTQFLAVNQAAEFPNYELPAYARRELLKRYREILPEDAETRSLDELMTAVGAWLRETQEAEPHKVLAGLPFPIYITAHPANLLTAALQAEDKDPEVEVCRWSDAIRWPRSVFDSQPRYRPHAERPLVFHLFGRLENPSSLVLTEDDYFDYLIGVTSNRELIPPVVRRALADTCLLFLGFRMDEWGFRVLFRSIMNQEGGGLLAKYSHVAVQIDPEESSTLEPDRARRYLESYFRGADITIYWGSVEDFVRELRKQWKKWAP